jgi:cytochrome P450
MDLIADLAFPLPFVVISEMLGIPEGRDRSQLREWSGAVVKTFDPIITRDETLAAFEAADNIVAYVDETVAWKREHPADDLLSALIAAEDEGDRLSAEELTEQVLLLYIAGHETTVNLIGNGMLALLRQRDQLEGAPTRSGTRRRHTRRVAALRQPGADEPADHARAVGDRRQDDRAGLTRHDVSRRGQS